MLLSYIRCEKKKTISLTVCTLLNVEFFISLLKTLHSKLYFMHRLYFLWHLSVRYQIVLLCHKKCSMPDCTFCLDTKKRVLYHIVLFSTRKCFISYCIVWTQECVLYQIVLFEHKKVFCTRLYCLDTRKCSIPDCIV